MTEQMDAGYTYDALTELTALIMSARKMRENLVDKRVSAGAVADFLAHCEAAAKAVRDVAEKPVIEERNEALADVARAVGHATGFGFSVPGAGRSRRAPPPRDRSSTGPDGRLTDGWTADDPAAPDTAGHAAGTPHPSRTRRPRG